MQLSQILKVDWNRIASFYILYSIMPNVQTIIPKMRSIFFLIYNKLIFYLLFTILYDFSSSIPYRESRKYNLVQSFKIVALTLHNHQHFLRHICSSWAIDRKMHLYFSTLYIYIKIYKFVHSYKCYHFIASDKKFCYKNRGDPWFFIFNLYKPLQITKQYYIFRKSVYVRCNLNWDDAASGR